MMKALKFVSLGLSIVLLIAVLANIPTALKALEEQSQVASTSVLTIERGEAPQDVQLTILPAEQSLDLEYGTRAEVYKFKMAAEKAYALRYLSFDVSWDGLNNSPLNAASNWRVFLAESEVGVGEKLENGRLKVRMFQDEESALFLPQGDATLSLTANVLRDYNSESDPFVTVFMPADGYFGWTHNLDFNTWMNLEEKFGADLIDGLPSQSVNKR